VVLLAVALADAQPPSHAALRTIEIGLCEDYPEETRSIEQARRDFEALRAAGITHLRISLGWDGIEVEDDRFDWAFWDEFIRVATDEYGLTLLPYLCYTPDWAAPPGAENAQASPPADPMAFAEFAGAAAERYRGRIRTWELWNEPDNPAYWTGSAGEFAAMFAPAAAAVREADPGAAVVLGGLAWDLDFLLALFRDHGIAPWVDIVNLHSYNETWSPDPAETVREHVARAAEITDAYGEGEPLWMAEVGYSTYREGSRVSDVYRAAYAYEHTERSQAAHLLKTMAMLAATGEIDLIAWYEVRDLPTGEPVIGDVNNRHLGVLGAQWEPKPAFEALRLAAAVFSRPLRVIDGHVLVTRAIGSDAETHAFERPDGTVMIFAWLRTVTPDRPRTPEGDAADLRRETIDLWVPGEFSRIVAADELGRVGSAEFAVEERDGGTVLRGVTLAGGGVRVLVLSPRR